MKKRLNNLVPASMLGYRYKYEDNGKMLDMTYKYVCLSVLLNNKEEDGIKKFNNYELAKKINTDNEVDLTPEEITIINEYSKQVLSTELAGMLIDYLK